MTSDKDGNYSNAYTYGLDRISVDYLASDETAKRDPLYYLYDGRGSVAQLTNSLGQAKDKYSYDPFGNTNHGGPLGNSEAHFQSFFGFNGEEYNNISGLQYLRARYYESGTGRFLTRDSYLGSLTEPLSLNRYAYTSNNPVMNIDPSGHRRLSMAGDEEYDLAASSSSYGTLRNGSRYGDVSTLQQLLKNAGFNPGTIDGLFGNNTESAVRAYQQSRGLTNDGIVGKQTWDSLLSSGTPSYSDSSSSSLPTELLRKGSSGPAVQKLQQTLINLGYNLGSYGADGIFGSETEKAVISFQDRHNLSIDGVVGSQTWGALRETLNLADRSRRDRCAGTDYIDNGTDNTKSSSNTSSKSLGSKFLDKWLQICDKISEFREKSDTVVTILSFAMIPVTGITPEQEMLIEEDEALLESNINRVEVVFQKIENDMEGIIKGANKAKGLIGKDFEDFLEKELGGKGSFKVGGREFDGAVDNVWYEAKSGEYWDYLMSSEKNISKFKSDMGDRLNIARQNGATYELHSNTLIPQTIKDWLTKKGILFTEW